MPLVRSLDGLALLEVSDGHFSTMKESGRVFTWVEPGAYYQEVETRMHPLSSAVPKPNHDPVHHPSHYTSNPSGVECIEITRHLNFNLGNAVKYIWRCGLKEGEDEIQGLEKAIWYLQDEVRRRKGN